LQLLELFLAIRLLIKKLKMRPLKKIINNYE
jgi:hypothetical protein